MALNVDAMVRDIQRIKNEQSEVERLRREVAELKAKKNKKKNIPWALVGFFGTDYGRKRGWWK